MSKLSDFGAGSLPEKSNKKVAHKTRTDRAKHRRETYRLGRCRAISKSKYCRCGGAVIEDTDGELCHYHGVESDSPVSQVVTIDDDAGLLARWCGTKGTMWEQIPELCREALQEVDPDAEER